MAIAGYVNTLEGCASICNATGTLLFSTDGITVYDVNGATIVGGLSGDPSSSQSGVIVPDPASVNRYYIFTCGAGGTGGISYSIIDMTLNGGLGGMILTDVPLVNVMCEKLCAVYAANGIDIWVVGHEYGNNNFRAYRITPAGIDAATVSSTGTAMSINPAYAGYLKASHDGTKLAAACPGISAGDAIFEVYDFNNLTGAVSNPILVPTTQSQFYGVSFSPNDTKLYVSSYADADHILQYDLSNANWWNSPYVVCSGGALMWGALQLAPDGKIYCAQSSMTALSTINNPDAAGVACDFQLNNFPILGSSGIGLPNVFEQLSIPISCSVNLGNDLTLCGMDTLILDAGVGGINYLWSDGSTNQTLSVSTAGLYFVEKENADSCIAYDTILVISENPPQVNLGNDTVLCTELYIIIDAGAGQYTYLWNIGSNAQIIHPSLSGTYWVDVTSAGGCTGSDTINVLFQGLPVELGNDTTICKGNNLFLTPGLGYSDVSWSSGETTDSILIEFAGEFFVSAIDTYGCKSVDSVSVFISDPSINLGEDTLLCGNLNYTINAGSGWSAYHWANNNNQSTQVTTTVGNYSVTVTDQFGCTASDTIEILNSNPQVTLGADEIICSYDSTLLSPTSGFVSYLWSTGSTEQNITVSLPGNYSVTITDQFNCTDSDSKLISVDTPFIFIGNDTSNCNGGGIVFHAGIGYSNYLWSNNNITESLTTSGAGLYSVTVTDINGCVVADTANITYENCVDVQVPTGFSPNSDGVNDYFHILNAQDFLSAEIKIYNRWGELIYLSKDKNGYWNGTYLNENCEVGVYVFVIAAKNYLGHDVFKKGNLTLLR